MRHRTAGGLVGAIMSVAVWTVACSRHENGKSNNNIIAAEIKAGSAGGKLPGTQATVFDSGIVIADGKKIKHSFLIKNNEKTSFNIIKAFSYLPCCSSIGPLPKAVLPGETVPISVEVNVGEHSGLKEVKFVVITDSKNNSELLYLLRAKLYAGIEVVTTEGSDTLLTLGETGRQRLRVVSRRIATEGKNPVVSEIEAIPPVTIEAVSEPADKELPGGVVETSREVIVVLPKANRKGEHQGSIRLKGSNGFTKSCSIAWKVREIISVVPSGFVYNPLTKNKKFDVLLKSRGVPFKVIAVTGRILAGYQAETEGAAMYQHLSLTLDESKLNKSGNYDIIINTDLLNQQSLTLSVVVLPSE